MQKFQYLLFMLKRSYICYSIICMTVPLKFVFSIAVATHMRTSYWLQWFCALLFYCGHLLITWKSHWGLKFHFGQIGRSEISTEVSSTSPELMWTLIMKLPYTKVKFHPEVKSQTGLGSLRVSCKHALTI